MLLIVPCGSTEGAVGDGQLDGVQLLEVVTAVRVLERQARGGTSSPAGDSERQEVWQRVVLASHGHGRERQGRAPARCHSDAQEHLSGHGGIQEAQPW